MQLLLNCKACSPRVQEKRLNLKPPPAVKMLCIFLMMISFQIATEGYAQGISISLKNAPLEKLFKLVEHQTNFHFVYSQEAMEHAKPVTIEVRNESLENVLKLSFVNQPFTYSFDDKFIIVKVSETQKETINVSGRVLNERREAVEGVSVVIKGTQMGTTTDGDGYFALRGVNENAILSFTGVSIEPMEITVAGKSNIPVSVKTKISLQKEIIIDAGYYKITDRLKTGNISQVGSATIANQPVSNPLEALEGRMPGVYIQQTSGVSGSGINIEIRGKNSLRNVIGGDNGNLPLFVVDGVPIISSSLDQNTAIAGLIAPLISPLNSINPSDIESIEVLKDADATAIYGSRGANGVVLITTKKGKAGKTKVEVNFYSGAGKVTRMMDLLNSEQYMQMRHEAIANDGVSSVPDSYYDIKGIWDTTRYTDWQKALIGGTSHITNAEINISGGSQNTQFLFGVGYFSQSTVFPGDFSDKKGSAHFNLTHLSENKRFTTTLSVNYVADVNNLPQQDPTGAALSLPPVAPAPFNNDGTINWANNTWFPFAQPYATFSQPYSGNTNNLIANSIISYEIFPGLRLKTSFGYNSMVMNQTRLIPISSQDPAFSPTGLAAYSNQSYNSWIVEPQLDYQRSISKGKINVLIGSTFQQNLTNAQAFDANGFTSDAALENPQAAASITPGNLTYIKYRYNAVFGRINYNWEDKYLINLTGRRDGSSRFGPGKQFANFGAIGMGWVFSNEPFLKQSLPFLSYGKIRASYGTTGNDQIPDYGYLNTYATTTSPYNGTSGLLVNGLFNADFAWETNKKIEGAIELGFAKDRILLACSHYRNRSSNQLVGYPLPTITGQPSLQYYNLPATVQNDGWEFELRTINLNGKDFTWTTSANFTLPKNKLIAYPGIEKSSYVNIYVVGQSLYIQKLYHFLGVDRQTGVYTFEDVDKDNQISNPDDLQALKSIEKKYYGGLSNNFKYKNFQLDIFFQFVRQTGLNYLSGFTVPGARNNQPIIVLDRWQKPSDNNDIQKFTRNAITSTAAAYSNLQSSDAIISDASFIRLKNIYLSYQLPSEWLSKLRMQTAKLFIQGQNLFTITNYLGLDPETQSNSSIPPLKMLTLGIQIIL